MQLLTFNITSGTIFYPTSIKHTTHGKNMKDWILRTEPFLELKYLHNATSYTKRNAIHKIGTYFAWDIQRMPAHLAGRMTNQRSGRLAITFMFPQRQKANLDACTRRRLNRIFSAYTDDRPLSVDLVGAVCISFYLLELLPLT